MWTEIPSEEIVRKTIEALKGRGVNVEFLKNRAEALKRLTELIPPGAELSTGASTTLEEIGFTDLLKSGNHP
jgi:L-lactate utilization protein LutB